MPGMISTGQFGHTAQTGSGFNPGPAIANMAKSFTGVSDFQQAGQSFSKGNILGGIGHAALGAVNALSTAAMVVPGIGEAVKGADIGLNMAVKGADVVKGVDAAKPASSMLHSNQFDKAVQPTLPGISLKGQSLKIVPSDTPSFYHGSPVEIPKGSTLNPSHYEGLSTYKGINEQKSAFASTNVHEAAGYARQSQRSRVSDIQDPQGEWGYIHKVSAPTPSINPKPGPEFTGTAHSSPSWKVMETTHKVNRTTGEIVPLGNNKMPGIKGPTKPSTSSGGVNQSLFSDSQLGIKPSGI